MLCIWSKVYPLHLTDDALHILLEPVYFLLVFKSKSATVYRHFTRLTQSSIFINVIDKSRIKFKQITLEIYQTSLIPNLFGLYGIRMSFQWTFMSDIQFSHIYYFKLTLVLTFRRIRFYKNSSLNDLVVIFYEKVTFWLAWRVLICFSL